MKISIISFGKFHSFDLSRELIKLGCEVTVYSSYPKFVAKKYGIKKIYSFFVLQIIDRITSRKFSKLIVKFFASLVYLILKKNQDYFIIWSDTPNFLTLRIKNAFNSKIILERGSAHIKTQLSLLINEYKRFNVDFKVEKNEEKIEMKNYDLADFIIIPSLFSRETFLKEGVNEKKLFVNPYGADLNKFYSKKNKKDLLTILTCGFGSVRKGFYHVLESHKYIEGEFLHIHVGNIENILKKDLVKYPRLKCFKSTSHDKLIHYYNSADVLIFPSIEDGFGMVILEAMACGLPVICSENTGFSTIVNQTNLEFGFSVKIRSPREIAEKVNLLRNKNIKEKLSLNSIEIIKKGGFKWSDYGLRYLMFLKEKNNIDPNINNKI